MDLEKLSNDLYNAANKIVGNVGENVPLDKFIEFICYEKELSKILPIWEQWIKNYVGFAKFYFTDPVTKVIFEQSPAVIYWRTKPEIRKRLERYQVYARLLISNISPKQYELLAKSHLGLPPHVFEENFLAPADNAEWIRC